MAKILYNPFGQMSGKMGGVVFARNKAGDYVRSLTKGINPRTAVQIKARNAFGAVTSLFRQLSASEKTLWQEFADNYYQPRVGGNTGQFSGYNAFIALRSVVQQAYNRALEPTILNGATDITSGVTFSDFEPMPETPIAGTFAPAVQGTGSESYLLSLSEGQVTQDGEYQIVLQVGDGQGHDLAGNLDNSDYNIGYAVYVSYGNPDSAMSYSNQFAQNLGYIKPWNADTPGTDLLDVETLTAENDIAFPIGDLKRFALIDEYVLLTVFAVNKYGMLSRIGSKEVQVTSTIV